MILVNMHEAKTTLSKLIKRMEGGEVVRIARNGQPVAELAPLNQEQNPLEQNPRLKGKIRGDIMAPLWPEGWEPSLSPLEK